MGGPLYGLITWLQSNPIHQIARRQVRWSKIQIVPETTTMHFGIGAALSGRPGLSRTLFAMSLSMKRTNENRISIRAKMYAMKTSASFVPGRSRGAMRVDRS
jgi:hypothetical protein